MTPEQRAKNHYCRGDEPVTPYEKAIVADAAGLIRQAVIEEVAPLINEAVEQERQACADIASAMVSARGNEQEIARAILARSK